MEQQTINLRKCKVSYENGKLFYFHKWTEEGRYQIHPMNPSEDKPYIITKAILENVETGEVDYRDADSITFI